MDEPDPEFEEDDHHGSSAPVSMFTEGLKAGKVMGRGELGAARESHGYQGERSVRTNFYGSFHTNGTINMSRGSRTFAI